MRVVAVVQARTGSSRLPAKIFKTVGSQTVFTHVLARAKAIPGVGDVHVTTTSRPEDDAVVNRCRGAGVTWSRGQAPMEGGKNDVLAGYLRAAEETRADVVLRITSDCPLLAPEVAGDVLAALFSGSFSYASNVCPPSWYDGCEVEAFTVEALSAAHRQADPGEREHVTTWIRRQCAEGYMRGVNVSPGLEHDLQWVKLSVDERADLRRVRRVWQHLRNRSHFGWRDVVRAYYDAFPTPIVTLGRMIYGSRSRRAALVDQFARGAAGAPRRVGDGSVYDSGASRAREVPPHERDRLLQFYHVEDLR